MTTPETTEGLMHRNMPRAAFSVDAVEERHINASARTGEADTTRRARSDKCVALLNPGSIAVAGASDRPGPGNRVVSNLIAGRFQGPLYLVNRNHDRIAGIPAYPSLEALPETPELVIAAVDREAAAEVVGTAAAAGSPACLLLAAGFGESDERGRELEQRVRESAQEMALMGPNCLGYVNLEANVAAYSGPLMEPYDCGSVALVSNSGALACTLTGIAAERGIRFSYVITTGNGINVNLAGYVRYLSTRPVVNVIACYVEGFQDGRQLLDAFDMARANGKHVVLLKAGRSVAGREAAKSHTAALAGSDAIQQDLWRQHDILLADDLEEFTALIQICSRYPSRKRARLGIVTISGGERLMLADAAERFGLPLATLAPETLRELSDLLPFYASPSNPLDTTGAGLVERDSTVHAAAVRILAQDPSVDMIVVSQDIKNGWIQSEHRSDLFYDGIVASTEALSTIDKPPLFLSPTVGEVDLRARAYLIGQESTLLLGLAPGLGSLSKFLRSRTHVAQAKITAGEWKGASQSEAVTGYFAMERLRQAGVEVWPTMRVESEDDAAAAATRLGYPAVLKLDGLGLLHRTEQQGVSLDLRDEATVRLAFRELLSKGKEQGLVEPAVLVQRLVGTGVEVFAGGIRDEQFGPIVLVGSGGILTELIDDAIAALAPLDIKGASDLLRRTKVYSLLDGWRGGQKIDIMPLCRTLSAISEVIAQPDISALDVNPLIVRNEGVALVDAKLLLTGPRV